MTKTQALSLQNELPEVFAHDTNGDFSVYDVATIKDRIFSAVLDGFLLGIIIKVCILIVQVYGAPWINVVYILPISITVNFLIVSIYLIYPMRVFGATPGKKLLNIQVVNMHNSEKLGIHTIILREFFYKTIGMIFFMLGFIMVFVRSDKRALHDLLAKTRVISKK